MSFFVILSFILGSHRGALVVRDQGVADLIEFLLPSLHFTFNFSFKVFFLVIKLQPKKKHLPFQKNLHDMCRIPTCPKNLPFTFSTSLLNWFTALQTHLSKKPTM
jgi:hypothetical protein